MLINLKVSLYIEQLIIREAQRSWVDINTSYDDLSWLKIELDLGYILNGLVPRPNSTHYALYHLICCVSYDNWLHFIILISAGMKTLSQQIWFRWEELFKSTDYKKRTGDLHTNIMECVKMLASFAATSSLNMQAIRRSIQHLVDRFSKLKNMFRNNGRQLYCF